MSRLACLLLLLCTARGFYSDTSGVVSLTASTFKSKIGKGGYWIVEFYAPWCGHCQKLKPEYEKLAKICDGLINVAAVDCDADKSIAAEFGVKGFPTIKLLYASSTGSLNNVDYSGGRTAKEIFSWALDQVGKVALKKIGAKSSNKSKKSKSGSKGSEFYGSDSDVVNIVDIDEVVDSEDLWMVEFYAPWCGHCQNLKSDWNHAATELKGRVKVGAVDCTAHESICAQFGVQGFPTLKFFGADKKSPMDYPGGRDSASIVAFALDKWAKVAPPPEVKEMTEPFIFEKYCSGSDESSPKQLCLLAFLPHILDSKASGRNNYVDILKRISVKYKEMQYGYLWAEGGKQPDIESSFGVGGFGYPAVVLYSPKKKAYSVLKAGLDYDHCVEFVDSVRKGFEKVMLLNGELAPATVTVPWDGNDAEEVLEDEFDLEDIMNEEL